MLLRRAALALPSLGALRRAFVAVPQATPHPWTPSTIFPTTSGQRLRTLKTTSFLHEHSGIDTPITADHNFRSSIKTSAADPLPSATPLTALHISHGAKMVPFAGYTMPLLYPPQTHISEHTWTREHASIFDVSHMVQHLFTGPGALAFLESLTPADLRGLAPFSSTLSVLLAHPTGGIVDDTIITMRASQTQFYIVTNAGCRVKDLMYFREALMKWQESTAVVEQGEVKHTVLEGWGLIALQGPEAKDVLGDYLARVVSPAVKVDLEKVVFGTSFEVSVPASERGNESVMVHIARGGYTGEDGFEISIPPVPLSNEPMAPLLVSNAPMTGVNPTAYITNELLKIGGEERVRMAGLAARDSLRLEAGMCLYGHDLNEDITPVEASLAWVVHKRRRADGLFPGGEIIQAQLAKNGIPPERKRVGLDLGVGGPPAREGMKIVKVGENGEKEVVGQLQR